MEHKPLILYIKSPKEQLNINQENITNSDKFDSRSTINTISPSNITSNLLPANEAQNNLYACILCNQFSFTKDTTKNHIILEHKELTIKNDPEIFITRLKAINAKPKVFKKPGRSKKISSQSLKEIKQSPSLIKEPEPTEDGLFWCDKCYKCFNKPRQLMKHICVKQNLTDNSCSSEEENKDDDTTGNFYMYLNRIGSSPSKNVQSSYLDKISDAYNASKVVETVPSFNKEKDKLIFKKHLNFFDYKSVKNMFIKVKSSLKYDSQEFSCKICQKVFPSSSNARMHCLIHTNIKPFKCPECSYITKSKGSLYTHIKKHTGNFFTCSYCDYKSANKGHLKDHEATHSSIFQQCKLCKHKYKTAKSLLNHVRRYHTDSRGNKYKKYLSSIQKKNTYPCHICHKIFNTVYALNLHSNKHKKDIVQESLILNEINVAENVENPDDSQVNVSNCLIISNSNNLECDNQTKTSDKLISADIKSESPHPIDVELSFHKDMHNISSTHLLEDFDSITVPQILPLLQNIKQIPFNEEPTFLNCESGFHNSQISLSNKDINVTTLSNLIENCQDVTNLDTDASLDNRLSTLCKEESSISSVPLLLNNGQNAVEHLNFNVHSSIPLEPILPKTIKQDEVEHLMYQASASSFPELRINDKQGAIQHLNLSLGTLNLDSQHLGKKCQELTETKLFEKCPRLLAYVCCVCSSIFIESQNLKNHLKQHAGDASNLINEQEIEFSSKNTDDIDVSAILQDQSSDLTTFNKLLEELYLSSLDKSYYLPELSVNLEYDPSLFDAFLEDSSNFSINGNEESKLNSKRPGNLQD